MNEKLLQRFLQTFFSDIERNCALPDQIWIFAFVPIFQVKCMVLLTFIKYMSHDVPSGIYTIGILNNVIVLIMKYICDLCGNL